MLDVEIDALRRDLQRRRTLVAHTLYECSTCGERRLGERRCSDCGLFSHAVGLAGHCPGCDEPILVTELLDLD
jgi:ribosomal protein L32